MSVRGSGLGLRVQGLWFRVRVEEDHEHVAVDDSHKFGGLAPSKPTLRQQNLCGPADWGMSH